MSKGNGGDEYAKAWTRGFAEGVAEMLREGHHAPALKAVAAKTLRASGMTLETMREAGAGPFELSLLKPLLPVAAPVVEAKAPRDPNLCNGQAGSCTFERGHQGPCEFDD